ncbi:MAG: hypothetical protein OXB84_01955, partial [Halobacteriovoraceae bacterium]|nr:hypothetical protein [Halobacteriovoraceae bacterium]
TWLEEDSYLIVIYVSDENDSSPGTVSYYVDELRKFKKNEGLVKLCAITNNQGIRYKKAAEKTMGLIADIRQSFRDILDEFGDLISGLSKAFSLRFKADEDTIEITVGGVPSPKDHWTYDSEKNSISFNEDNVPEVGQEIKIVYKKLKNKNELEEDEDEDSEEE